MMDIDKLNKGWDELVESIKYAIRNRTAPNSIKFNGKTEKEFRDDTMETVSEEYYDKGQTQRRLNDWTRESEDSLWTIMGYRAFEPSKFNIEGIFKEDEEISSIISIDDQTYLLFGSRGNIAKTTDTFQTFTGKPLSVDDRVTAVAYSSELIVVGTKAGHLLQSNDLGESWVEVDLSITNLDEFEFDDEIVAIRLDSAGYWYISSKTQFIRSSSTGWEGGTFEAEAFGIPPAADKVQDFDIEPDTDHVYIAADTGLYYTETGDTWYHIETGLDNNVCFVRFSNRKSLVACNEQNVVAVRRSKDHDWITGELQEPIVDADSNEDGLWVGVGIDGGIYRSLDDGYRWRRILREQSGFSVHYRRPRWVLGRTYGDYLLARDD